MPMTRTLVLTGALLVLGCAREGGPARAPGEAAAPGGQAAGSPPGASVTGEPSVQPALETLEGEASYYSDSLAGRSTASGEPYDPPALTAAHRTLPFGTHARVTRMGSAQSVVVRINDRGPFGKERRIIDLSRSAAEQLDMIRAGVIEVRVEVIEYGSGKRSR